jgi:broad specificity phosphatase PhoE
MRVVFVIRHGQSEGNRHNRAAFGKAGGALTVDGVKEAKQLGGELRELGLEVSTEAVAVSELQRTSQTAHYAGFEHITKYTVLNEINSGLTREELDTLLKRLEVPAIAIAAAQKILSNPPKEKVWVTHGLVIAALAHELGISPNKIFIPPTGSVTKLVLS